eukprot:snap_masked-scaffold_1-processed-gene-10.25-mRNA-1 protein AED:1.00 eAED:1.00 QI:0/0/0/0/1/1/2/0/4160
MEFSSERFQVFEQISLFHLNYLISYDKSLAKGTEVEEEKLNNVKLFLERVRKRPLFLYGITVLENMTNFARTLININSRETNQDLKIAVLDTLCKIPFQKIDKRIVLKLFISLSEELKDSKPSPLDAKRLKIFRKVLRYVSDQKEDILLSLQGVLKFIKQQNELYFKGKVFQQDVVTTLSNSGEATSFFTLLHQGFKCFLLVEHLSRSWTELLPLVEELISSTLSALQVKMVTSNHSPQYCKYIVRGLEFVVTSLASSNFDNQLSSLGALAADTMVYALNLCRNSENPTRIRVIKIFSLFCEPLLIPHLLGQAEILLASNLFFNTDGTTIGEEGLSGKDAYSGKISESEPLTLDLESKEYIFLATSVLREFCHKARESLSLQKISEVIRLFYRLLHDSRLELRVQHIVVGILSDFSATVYDNEEEEPCIARDLLSNLLYHLVLRLENVLLACDHIEDKSDKEKISSDTLRSEVEKVLTARKRDMTSCNVHTVERHLSKMVSAASSMINEKLKEFQISGDYKQHIVESAADFRKKSAHFVKMLLKAIQNTVFRLVGYGAVKANKIDVTAEHDDKMSKSESSDFLPDGIDGLLIPAEATLMDRFLKSSSRLILQVSKDPEQKRSLIKTMVGVICQLKPTDATDLVRNNAYYFYSLCIRFPEGTQVVRYLLEAEQLDAVSLVSFLELLKVKLECFAGPRNIKTIYDKMNLKQTLFSPTWISTNTDPPEFLNSIEKEMMKERETVIVTFLVKQCQSCLDQFIKKKMASAKTATERISIQETPVFVYLESLIEEIIIRALGLSAHYTGMLHTYIVKGCLKPAQEPWFKNAVSVDTLLFGEEPFQLVLVGFLRVLSKRQPFANGVLRALTLPAINFLHQLIVQERTPLLSKESMYYPLMRVHAFRLEKIYETMLYFSLFLSKENLTGTIPLLLKPVTCALDGFSQGKTEFTSIALQVLEYWISTFEPRVLEELLFPSSFPYDQFSPAGRLVECLVQFSEGQPGSLDIKTKKFLLTLSSKVREELSKPKVQTTAGFHNLLLGTFAADVGILTNCNQDFKYVSHLCHLLTWFQEVYVPNWNYFVKESKTTSFFKKAGEVIASARDEKIKCFQYARTYCLSLLRKTGLLPFVAVGGAPSVVENSKVSNVSETDKKRMRVELKVLLEALALFSCDEVTGFIALPFFNFFIGLIFENNFSLSGKVDGSTLVGFEALSRSVLGLMQTTDCVAVNLGVEVFDGLLARLQRSLVSTATDIKKYRYAQEEIRSVLEKHVLSKLWPTMFAGLLGVNRFILHVEAILKVSGLEQIGKIELHAMSKILSLTLRNLDEQKGKVLWALLESNLTKLVFIYKEFSLKQELIAFLEHISVGLVANSQLSRELSKQTIELVAEIWNTDVSKIFLQIPRTVKLLRSSLDVKTLKTLPESRQLASLSLGGFFFNLYPCPIIKPIAPLPQNASAEEVAQVDNMKKHVFNIFRKMAQTLVEANALTQEYPVKSTSMRSYYGTNSSLNVKVDNERSVLNKATFNSFADWPYPVKLRYATILLMKSLLQEKYVKYIFEVCSDRPNYFDQLLFKSCGILFLTLSSPWIPLREVAQAALEKLKVLHTEKKDNSLTPWNITPKLLEASLADLLSKSSHLELLTPHLLFSLRNILRVYVSKFGTHLVETTIKKFLNHLQTLAKQNGPTKKGKSISFGRRSFLGAAILETVMVVPACVNYLPDFLLAAVELQASVVGTLTDFLNISGHSFLVNPVKEAVKQLVGAYPEKSLNFFLEEKYFLNPNVNYLLLHLLQFCSEIRTRLLAHIPLLLELSCISNVGTYPNSPETVKRCTFGTRILIHLTRQNAAAMFRNNTLVSCMAGLFGSSVLKSQQKDDWVLISNDDLPTLLCLIYTLFFDVALTEPTLSINQQSFLKTGLYFVLGTISFRRSYPNQELTKVCQKFVRKSMESKVALQLMAYTFDKMSNDSLPEKVIVCALRHIMLPFLVLLKGKSAEKRYLPEFDPILRKYARACVLSSNKKDGRVRWQVCSYKFLALSCIQDDLLNLSPEFDSLSLDSLGSSFWVFLFFLMIKYSVGTVSISFGETCSKLEDSALVYNSLGVYPLEWSQYLSMISTILWSARLENALQFKERECLQLKKVNFDPGSVKFIVEGNPVKLQQMVNFSTAYFFDVDLQITTDSLHSLYSYLVAGERLGYYSPLPPRLIQQLFQNLFTAKQVRKLNIKWEAIYNILFFSIETQSFGPTSKQVSESVGEKLQTMLAILESSADNEEVLASIEEPVCILLRLLIGIAKEQTFPFFFLHCKNLEVLATLVFGLLTKHVAYLFVDLLKVLRERIGFFGAVDGNSLYNLLMRTSELCKLALSSYQAGNDQTGKSEGSGVMNSYLLIKFSILVAMQLCDVAEIGDNLDQNVNSANMRYLKKFAPSFMELSLKLLETLNVASDQKEKQLSRAFRLDKEFLKLLRPEAELTSHQRGALSNEKFLLESLTQVVSFIGLYAYKSKTLLSNFLALTRTFISCYQHRYYNLTFSVLNIAKRILTEHFSRTMSGLDDALLFLEHFSSLSVMLSTFGEEKMKKKIFLIFADILKGFARDVRSCKKILLVVSKNQDLLIMMCYGFTNIHSSVRRAFSEVAIIFKKHCRTYLLGTLQCLPFQSAHLLYQTLHIIQDLETREKPSSGPSCWFSAKAWEVQSSYRDDICHAVNAYLDRDSLHESFEVSFLIGGSTTFGLDFNQKLRSVLQGLTDAEALPFYERLMFNIREENKLSAKFAPRSATQKYVALRIIRRVLNDRKTVTSFDKENVGTLNMFMQSVFQAYYRSILLGIHKSRLESMYRIPSTLFHYVRAKLTVLRKEPDYFPEFAANTSFYLKRTVRENEESMTRNAALFQRYVTVPVPGPMEQDERSGILAVMFKSRASKVALGYITRENWKIASGLVLESMNRVVAKKNGTFEMYVGLEQPNNLPSSTVLAGQVPPPIAAEPVLKEPDYLTMFAESEMVEFGGTVDLTAELFWGSLDIDISEVGFWESTWLNSVAELQEWDLVSACSEREVAMQSLAEHQYANTLALKLRSAADIRKGGRFDTEFTFPAPPLETSFSLRRNESEIFSSSLFILRLQMHSEAAQAVQFLRLLRQPNKLNRGDPLLHITQLAQSWKATEVLPHEHNSLLMEQFFFRKKIIFTVASLLKGDTKLELFAKEVLSVLYVGAMKNYRLKGNFSVAEKIYEEFLGYIAKFNFTFAGEQRLTEMEQLSQLIIKNTDYSPLQKQDRNEAFFAQLVALDVSKLRQKDEASQLFQYKADLMVNSLRLAADNYDITQPVARISDLYRMAMELSETNIKACLNWRSFASFASRVLQDPASPGFGFHTKHSVTEVGCILQGAYLGDASAILLLPKVLWCVHIENQIPTINNSFLSGSTPRSNEMATASSLLIRYISVIPYQIWIPHMSNLFIRLSAPERLLYSNILQGLCNYFPQSVFNFLRLRLTEIKELEKPMIPHNMLKNQTDESILYVQRERNNTEQSAKMLWLRVYQTHPKIIQQIHSLIEELGGIMRAVSSLEEFAASVRKLLYKCLLIATDQEYVSLKTQSSTSGKPKRSRLLLIWTVLRRTLGHILAKHKESRDQRNANPQSQTYYLTKYNQDVSALKVQFAQALMPSDAQANFLKNSNCDEAAENHAISLNEVDFSLESVLKKLWSWKEDLHSRVTNNGRVSTLLKQNVHRKLSCLRFTKLYIPAEMDIQACTSITAVALPYVPKLYGFTPDIKLIQSTESAHWKINILGSDGKSYFYQLLNFGGIHHSTSFRPEFRMQSFFSSLNFLLRTNHLTRKRRLIYNTPYQLPLVSKLYLETWHEGTISLDSIYWESCAENNKDVLAHFINYAKAENTEEGAAALQKAFIEIKKDFGDDVFSKFLYSNCVDLDGVEFLRSELAYRFAVSDFLSYTFGVTEKDPKKIDLGVQGTNFGKVFSRGHLIRYNKTSSFGQLEKFSFDGEPDAKKVVPFRLTPNISHFLTQSNIMGAFLNALHTMSYLCHDENNRDILFDQLRYICLNDLTWSQLSHEQTLKFKKLIEAMKGWDNASVVQSNAHSMEVRMTGLCKKEVSADCFKVSKDTPDFYGKQSSDDLQELLASKKVSFEELSSKSITYDAEKSEKFKVDWSRLDAKIVQLIRDSQDDKLLSKMNAGYLPWL